MALCLKFNETSTFTKYNRARLLNHLVSRQFANIEKFLADWNYTNPGVGVICQEISFPSTRYLLSGRHNSAGYRYICALTAFLSLVVSSFRKTVASTTCSCVMSSDLHPTLRRNGNDS